MKGIDVHITFFEHILPQLISLFILMYGFIYDYSRYKNAIVNHFQISNFSLGVLFLLVGKMALFIFHNNPDLVKAYVDITLINFFLIFALTLARGSRFKRRWHIWLQIGIFPLLIELLKPKNTTGEYIFAADMYLVFLLLTSRFDKKLTLAISLILLGSINILSSYGVITYTQYAWTEPFGQLFFVIGLKHLIDNFVD